MKKLFLSILGTALLFTACTKNQLPQIEQLPYRAVVEYEPGSYVMNVPGKLTPVEEDYGWIQHSQEGGKVTFNFSRNTTGRVRRAEYFIEGSSYKAVISQRVHKLDATVKTAIVKQTPGKIAICANLSTNFAGDYDRWGIFYSKKDDRKSAEKTLPFKERKPSDKVVSDTLIIEEVGEVDDYYFWSYVVSTENDTIYEKSSVKAIPPLCVPDGDVDLAKYVDKAKKNQEIRVKAAANCTPQIDLENIYKSLKITGGWNNEFTEQSDTFSVIDGKGDFGIKCADVEISYFEFKNCKSSEGGAAIHICGGPLTIHNCYFHDNDGAASCIGMNENDSSNELYAYNCRFEDNKSLCVSLGAGISESNFVKAEIVNNLFAGNTGAGLLACNDFTQLNFVNNTVSDNTINASNSEGHYPGMKFSANTRVLLANNIIVGNFENSSDDHPEFVNLGGSRAVIVNNVIDKEVVAKDKVKKEENNEYIDLGSSGDVLDEDMLPKGKAIGKGVLDSFEPAFAGDKTENEVSVKDLLKKYNTDLAGNPRVVADKVDAGCYQKQ